MIEEVLSFENVRALVTKKCKNANNLFDMSLAANRHYLQKVCNLPSSPLWLKQTHSDIVINSSDYYPNVNADSIFTQDLNKILTIITADCMPILLYSPKCIAAIHVGWRGLVNGIIGKTIQNLPDMSFKAWIGPCIGPKHFRVDTDVADKIMRSIDKVANSNFINLAEVAKTQLIRNKINDIVIDGRCTVINNDDFFSYRQEKHGRFASLIWLV